MKVEGLTNVQPYSTGLIEGFIKMQAERHLQEKDKIIRHAFEKHFGFPIENVLDKDALGLLYHPEDPLQYFTYAGEIFLEWEVEIHMKEQPYHKGESHTFMFINYYREV